MGLHSSLLRFILLSFYFLKPKTTQTLKMPKGSGLTKPMKLSAELADIVGKKEASRAECIKQLWAYIKKNNLQDPENKQFFNPDKKMAKIFGNDRIRAFSMAKFLSAHLSFLHPLHHSSLNYSRDASRCIPCSDAPSPKDAGLPGCWPTTQPTTGSPKTRS